MKKAPILGGGIWGKGWSCLKGDRRPTWELVSSSSLAFKVTVAGLISVSLCRSSFSLAMR